MDSIISFFHQMMTVGDAALISLLSFLSGIGLGLWGYFDYSRYSENQRQQPVNRSRFHAIGLPPVEESVESRLAEFRREAASLDLDESDQAILSQPQSQQPPQAMLFKRKLSDDEVALVKGVFDTFRWNFKERIWQFKIAEQALASMLGVSPRTIAAYRRGERSKFIKGRALEKEERLRFCQSYTEALGGPAHGKA